MVLENSEHKVFRLEDVQNGDYLLDNGIILATDSGSSVLLNAGTLIKVKLNSVTGLEGSLQIDIPGVGKMYLKKRDFPLIALSPQ